MDFTNKKDSKYGIHYSRWVASWAISGGRFRHEGLWLFKDWLRSCGLDEEDVKGIASIADNGKVELEALATKFIKENKDKYNR